MGEAYPKPENVMLRRCAEVTEPWHALKVRTRSEMDVSSVLTHLGFLSYCPTISERRRYCDRMKTVKTAAFPGYIFCKFRPEEMFELLNSTAIEYVVSFGDKPATILEEQISSLRRVIDSGGTSRPFLRVGQRVRVTHGALAGVEGILLKEPESEDSKLVFSVDILERSISVVIPETYVTTI